MDSKEKKPQEKNEEYHVSVEPDKDLQTWYHSRIIIPIKTFERFIAIANNDPIWTDGYTLYSFLYYCSRLQKTDKPWVNKNYIKKVLHWGQERVYRTLKWLDEDVDVIDISDSQEKYKDGSFAKKFIKVKYIPKATVYPFKYTEQVKESKELSLNRVPVTAHGDEYANCFKYKSNKREKGSSKGNSKNCHSSEPKKVKHIINPIVAKSLPPESNQFFNLSNEIDKKQKKELREKLDRIEAKVQGFAENK